MRSLRESKVFHPAQLPKDKINKGLSATKIKILNKGILVKENTRVID